MWIKRNSPDMLLYAQEVQRISGNRHEALLDVVEMSTHEDLRVRYGGDMPRRYFRRASMIRMTYPISGHSGMRQGNWYRLPLDGWEGGRYTTVSRDQPGSAYLRANFAFDELVVNFRQFRVPSRDIPRTPPLPPGLDKLITAGGGHSPLSLEIINCGHGNWNQVRFPHTVLLYDVGACTTYTGPQVRQLVKSRAISAEMHPLSLVISHWDVDHYQALLEFSPKELRKFRAVFVPSQVPPTETYRKVKSALNKAKVPIYAIAPATKIKSGTSIDLVRVAQTRGLHVFRATQGQSRNQTGIVLGLEGDISNALLTGDHHYAKLLDAAIHLNGSKRLIMVTPHHGGHAGKGGPDTRKWLSAFPKIETPISCGTNSWGHPFPYVLGKLAAMQGGHSPKKTIGKSVLHYSL